MLRLFLLVLLLLLLLLLQTFLPLDLRTKQTRAIRRRLTKEQVRHTAGQRIHKSALAAALVTAAWQV
jgi:hypothetical protein